MLFLLENTDLKCVPSADGLNPVDGEPYEVYFEGNPGTLTVLSTAN